MWDEGSARECVAVAPSGCVGCSVSFVSRALSLRICWHRDADDHPGGARAAQGDGECILCSFAVLAGFLQGWPAPTDPSPPLILLS